jgi:hypothetical protein
MAITTCLHADADVGAGQISCHNSSGAAIKSKWGLHHTSVPYRDRKQKAALV